MNFTCPWGPIILMEAVGDGLTDIVEFLLEAGADPNIANEVTISLPLPLLFI